MSNEQIAHDLAIAKLSGSTLPTDELVEEYHKEYTNIKKHLDSKKTSRPASIISSPM